MKALTTAFTMILLAAAPAMWAQQAPAPKTDAPGAQHAPGAHDEAAEHSMTGCLSSHDKTFMLKTSSGDVQIEGDGLQAHVGHTITVTGAPSEMAGKSEAGKTEAGKTAADKSVMKVTNIEMVANNCKS